MRRIINIVGIDVLKQLLKELAFMFSKIFVSAKAFGFKLRKAIFRTDSDESYFYLIANRLFLFNKLSF